MCRNTRDPSMVDIIDKHGAVTGVDLRDRGAIITLMGKADFEYHEPYLIRLRNEYEQTKTVKKDSVSH